MTTRLQDASTVVLLRDGDQGLEVLMAERGRRTAFSAGAWVFPGGAVDPGDAALATRCEDLDARRCETRFGEAGAARYYIAALRELFEEVGIWLFSPERPADWAARRDALHRDRRPLSEILGAIGISTAPLYYYRFWTTPPGQPRRYRTRFFLAPAPDQAPQPDGGEIVAAQYCRPADMLERYRRREISLIFPTVKELEALSCFETAAQALEVLAHRHEVPETRSRHRIENGRLVEILMPGEPGYEALPEWEG